MTDSSSEKSLFSLAQIQHLMRVEFNRAQRYDYPISCLMVAVDRLGHLRDMYGYEAKEEIIDAIVELLKGATRSSDFLGRLADDRLLAVVPHTGKTGVESMCGRLLEATKGIHFANQDRTIPVSISIGAASDGSEHGPSAKGERTMFFDTLIQTAEDALNDAIEDGGSRLVVLDPGPSGA
ncbi:MAG: GGDEF domain-containing protein [Planctomycetota bacterium]